MSTKIYQGYRVKVKDFNGFLAHLRAATLEKAAEHVKLLLSALLPEKEDELIKAWYPDFPNGLSEGVNPEFIKGYLKLNYLEKLFEGNHDNQMRGNVFDLQSGFTFFLVGGYFYGWPWGTFILSDKIVLAYDKAEDYCYWNSTDGPEEVSRSVWQRRAKTWNLIHDRGEFIYRLDYRTVDYSPGCYISAIEIQELVLPKKAGL